MKLGVQTRRTSVKDFFFNDTATTEIYTIPVVNTLDPLKLTVLDEDVTTEDVVGSASLDLNEKGIVAGPGWKEQVIELTHEGQKAGDLFIATRYTAMLA